MDVGLALVEQGMADWRGTRLLAQVCDIVQLWNRKRGQPQPINKER